MREAREASSRERPREARIQDVLLDRLAECERLGLRLRRFRLTVSEWRDLYSDFSSLPRLPREGETYLFCGYPIVVNWEKQG